MEKSMSTKSKIEFAMESKKEEMELILKTLKDDEILFNPDGIKIGVLKEIRVNDKKNGDGQAYQQIQFNVKAADGKNFSKKYSVDFTRKFFTQLGVKSGDILNANVVFKLSGRFNSIGFMAFVIKNKDVETGEISYDIKAYEDEGEDFSATLAKLGL